jgi:hypothetical protein
MQPQPQAFQKPKSKKQSETNAPIFAAATPDLLL